MWGFNSATHRGMHILALVMLPKNTEHATGAQREPEGAQGPQPVQTDKVPGVPPLRGSGH